MELKLEYTKSEYKYVVSRNLERWGGWLDYGDFIVLSGTDGKDGFTKLKIQ